MPDTKHAVAVVALQMQQTIIPRGRLEPGSYQVPFSFALPATIPGSFSYVMAHTT
jgi:hypothetical protein